MKLKPLQSAQQTAAGTVVMHVRRMRGLPGQTANPATLARASCAGPAHGIVPVRPEAQFLAV
jgi:hypothetical protein